MNGKPALCAPSSTNVDGRKRKRNLFPKPLAPSVDSKNRSQARVASKAARVYETVDLLSQQNKVNLLQDVTIKPANTLLSGNDAQQYQDVAIAPNILEGLIPITSQQVINTIFDDQETDNAIEALMATLDKTEKRLRSVSPDIFEESEDVYKTDTICFINEKIALLKTKIEASKKDIQEFKTEKTTLYKKLEDTQFKLKSSEMKLLSFEEYLKKFETFRDVL